MFGFLFGIGCLIALGVLLKRSRSGLWRHGRCSAHGRRYGRGRTLLRILFERLDTTPGQEKVIQQELDGLIDRGRELRGEATRSREDVARAVGTEHFDETILGELFSRHDDALRELRKDLVGALARVHEVLDEGQRQRLAKMLKTGPDLHGWGGPYRSWA